MTAVHDGVLMIPVYKRRVVGVVMGLWQALICFCIYIYIYIYLLSWRLRPASGITLSPDSYNQYCCDP